LLLAALRMAEFAMASPFHRLVELCALAWQLNSSNLAGQVTFVESGVLCLTLQAASQGFISRERFRIECSPVARSISNIPYVFLSKEFNHAKLSSRTFVGRRCRRP
jgi:hypothetical protein